MECTPEPAATDAFLGSGFGAAEELGQEQPAHLGSPFPAMGRVWGQCGMGGNWAAHVP